MRSRRNLEKLPKADSNTQGMVSLFLVLLCFFILLNTISNVHRKREREALGSIHDTFSEVDSASKLTVGKAAGKTVATVSAFSPIAQVARDTLSLVENTMVDAGNKMQITLASSALFEESNANLNLSQRNFLTRLANSFKTINQDYPIDIEIIFSGPDFPEIINAQTSLGVARAGVLAQTFVDLGIPAKNMAIGYVRDRGSYVTLNFFEHITDDTL